MSNKIHIFNPYGFVENDLITLAQYLDTWDSVHWKTCRTTQTLLTDIALQITDAVDSPQYAFSVPGGRAGTWGNTLVATSVCKAIKLVTLHGGRSGRGRIYTPPVGTTDFDSANQLGAAYLNRVLTALEVLIAGLHELTPYMALHVVSYRTGKQWRAYAESWPVETVVTVGLQPSTQRRRMPA